MDFDVGQFVVALWPSAEHEQIESPFVLFYLLPPSQ